MTRTREDGASRTTTTTFDPVGLVLTGTTTTAPGVPALHTAISVDSLSLRVTSVTDPNGAQHGTAFDGFDREILSTITPPGGVQGALSFMAYHGFTESDSEGRRIVAKVFPDPVVGVP